MRLSLCRGRLWGGLLVGHLLAALPAAAQTPPPDCSKTAWANDPIRSLVARLANVDPSARDFANDAAALTSLRSDVARSLLSEFITNKLFSDNQQLRLDKQLGSTTTGASSTSLVSKAASTLFGAAFEYGVGSKSTNGSTVTINLKPVDAVRQLVLAEPFLNGTATECDPPALRFLSRFSASATFLASGSDVNGGANQNAQFTQQNLQSFTVRFEVHNGRDPRRSDRAPQLVSDATVRASSLTPLEIKTIIDRAANDPAVTGIVGALAGLVGAQALQAGAPSNIVEAIAKKIEALKPATQDALSPELQTIAAAFAERNSKDFMAHAAEGTLVTAEFNYDRKAAGTTSLYNLKALLSRGMSGGNAEFTFNFSTNLVPSLVVTPLDAGPARRTISHFRDVQMAAQIDVMLGNARTNAGAVSVAGRFQYLNENPFTLDDTTIANKPGGVTIVQGKWTIPKGTATITPFSLTWSNRSELIDEAQIKGNVGVSLDLDSLLAKVHPH